MLIHYVPPPEYVVPVRVELRALGHDLLAPGAKITVQWLSPGRWIVKATVRGHRVGTLVAKTTKHSIEIAPRMSLHDQAAEKAAQERAHG